MWMAPKGHFFGQIPHPIHSRSEIYAIFDSGVTSMHSLPVRTTGQDFLHSCRHFCPRSVSVASMGKECSTHLRLAFVAVDDSNSSQLVRHGRGSQWTVVLASRWNRIQDEGKYDSTRQPAPESSRTSHRTQKTESRTREMTITYAQKWVSGIHQSQNNGSARPPSKSSNPSLVAQLACLRQQPLGRPVLVAWVGCTRLAFARLSE